MRLPFAIMLFLLLTTSQAVAHPHVFVDTQLQIEFGEEGLAEAVRVTWTYDDLTSLQIIADRGMDPDFNSALTAEEIAALSGFDMHWDTGYAGDTYALLEDVPLALAGPSEWTADYANDMITSTHLRRLAKPVDIGTGTFVVRVYDPTLFTGYYIVGEPKQNGTDHCDIRIQKPDLEAANALFNAAVAKLSTDVENDYPALGAAYAEEVHVTCNAPS